MNSEYEDSPEVLKHDLKLLNEVKLIKNRLQEIIELRIEEINSYSDRIRIVPYDREEMESHRLKIHNNRKQELEMYKKTLSQLSDLLDSAIREGTKSAILEMCDIFRNRIIIKENEILDN